MKCINPRKSYAERNLRLSLSLLGTFLILACAGMEDRRSVPSEERTSEGFTISETLRPRMGLRSDFALAEEALEAGELERAISILEPITESDSGFAAPHINLGMAYRESGRLEEAEAALLRALEVNPRHPVALNEIGIVYRRLGRFGEARESYERALAFHESFHYARKNLAILCDLFLSDIECALENYQAYRVAVPEDADVAIWIADLEARAESR
jgi:tetratricopeptide (TPR) repeat protein